MIKLYSEVKNPEKLQTLNYYLLNYVFSMYVKDYCKNNPNDANTKEWKNFINELRSNDAFNNLQIIDDKINNKDILALISNLI
jgi:hypothetical protein